MVLRQQLALEQLICQVDSMNIDIVDKKRYPNPFKAIFFDLALKGNGGPVPMVFFILIAFFGFIYCLQMEEGVATKYYGLVICPVVFLMPFFLATISYFSKLLIEHERFSLKAFGISYYQGSVEDIIELHQLDIYDGCFRVRVKGASVTSGFLLHWKDVPRPLKHLPVIQIYSSHL